MAATPILANSCARAASASEARYRIDAPIAPSRGARVIALDEGAAVVAARVAGHQWASTRFLVCDREGEVPRLRDIGGSDVELGEQLDGADVVVMIATQDAGAAGAQEIGRACWARSIMTAGVVLGDGSAAQHALAALRPHARVLLPAGDESDVIELLVALRA